MTRMFEERYVTVEDGSQIYYRDYAATGSGSGSGSGSGNDDVPILCLAGLTRNCRDFTDMIDALPTTRRIVAIDMRGRGKSDYAKDFRSYTVMTEISDTLAVMAAAQLHKVIVIGTSRGGLLAMTLAAQRPSVLHAVVLNDIGPQIELAGLARISGYVGKTIVPPTWPEAVAAIRALNEAVFPDFDDAKWNSFARNILKDEGGKPVLDYDRAIGDALAHQAKSGELTDMWALFGALKNIPVLVVRGANSDILSDEGVAAMKAAKPDLSSVLVPDRGHAPTLAEPSAIAALEQFIASLSAT